MTRPREGPDARSMSPSEAAAKKIADNTIEILRAERDRLFNTVAQQAAEIERLRAFEMAARDLNNDLTRIAKERDEMATQIKKLKEDLEQAERVIEARLEVIDQQAARIKELEDALVEELARGDYFDESQECEGYWWDRKNTSDCTQNDYRRNARLKLQAKSKIGPDADAKPRSWQITEERMRAIRMAEELAWDCKAVAVLRAMLQEAGL